jgi:hypothetical protein
LNGFVHAGTAARLIYHNRRGITACQENLSNGVFGPRRRFGPGRKSLPVAHSELPIEWNDNCHRSKPEQLTPGVE